MPTLMHANGTKKVELLPMTVKEARRHGQVPKKCVVIEKNEEGFSREVEDNEMLTREYFLVPSNKAG